MLDCRERNVVAMALPQDPQNTIPCRSAEPSLGGRAPLRLLLAASRFSLAKKVSQVT